MEYLDTTLSQYSSKKISIQKQEETMMAEIAFDMFLSDVFAKKSSIGKPLDMTIKIT